jgi:hypothetical protein
LYIVFGELAQVFSSQVSKESYEFSDEEKDVEFQMLKSENEKLRKELICLVYVMLKRYLFVNNHMSLNYVEVAKLG